jgi:predicted DNA-binding transcriptional regulator AlpA
MTFHKNQNSPSFGLMIEQVSGSNSPVDIKLPSTVIKSGQSSAGKHYEKAAAQKSMAGDASLAHKLVPLSKMNAYFGFDWSKVTYWRREQDGCFVPPIRIGRRVYYRYGEVLAWIEAQGGKNV